MKYIFKPFCLLLFVGICFSYSSSLASDLKLPLFTATSDAFSDQLEVNLTVDQDSNSTGFLYTLTGTDTSVGLENLPAGITLYQMSGKNVAVLSSKTFNAITGGPLTLTYLHDGVQGSYQKFNFNIARQGLAWNSYVTDANGIPRPFTMMYLTAKKLFGKVIGIDRISVK